MDLKALAPHVHTQRLQNSNLYFITRRVRKKKIESFWEGEEEKFIKSINFICVLHLEGKCKENRMS